MFSQNYLLWLIPTLCVRIVSTASERGPPKTKFTTTFKDVTFKQYVTISCLLCDSNPPSTITWYFNGKLVLLKKHRKIIKDSCGQKLSVQVLNEDDVGVYMCMVENELGRANSTTEVRGYAVEETSPSSKLNMEGEVMGRDARLGSTINITCTIHWPSKIQWSWEKGNKRLINETTGGRIEWKEENRKIEDNYTERMTRLTIKNMKYEDKGNYRCIGRRDLGRTLVKMSTIINVVPCFQGFYCPDTDAPQRCPKGTFSWLKNATTINDCTPCPTYSRNETLIDLQSKKPNIATVFADNCPNFSTSEFRSSLSTGQKVGIGVAIVALLLTVLLVLYAVQRWRKVKVSRLFEPSRFIDIEIPTVPLTNDVFVCYSSKNRTWVHDTLLANLNAQDFRTVIDIIDFEVGLAIHENIKKAIYGSKKTVFVLSKDAIKSFYARTELRQALVAKRQGRQVIIILYEKVELPVEITKRLYLDWTDEKNRDQFWEKLYREIRKPSDNEVV